MNTPGRLLPYTYERNSIRVKRLIVEPIAIPETLSENGLVVPEHELPNSQLGIVFQTCDDSDFKVGDEVQYLKSDRAAHENMDTISIGEKVYDVVYEPKIWVRNDRPYNQIFVRPISEAEVTEGGLIIPNEILNVTRKGIVVDAPDHFPIKKGDKVEYQNQVQGVYPMATVDGYQVDVLWESDIFTINGEVAPYRIIVRIDKVAQHLKRSSTMSGLKLSPLFIAMKENLQYAEITGIGAEAKKNYPELSKGDTILIHHIVESQDYRLVSQQKGKHDGLVSEERIINCYDFSEREIFGKLFYDKRSKKIIDIVPLNESVFLKWNFSMLKKLNTSEVLRSADDNPEEYDNLADLLGVVNRLRKDSAETAKIKSSGIQQMIIMASKAFDIDRVEFLKKELEIAKQEAMRISAHLRKDYLVVLETVFPQLNPRYMVAPYEVIYPINIMGHNYLIAHPDFLYFQSNTNMDITSADLKALSDNVLVLPIEEEQKTDLIIPPGARSRPQYGRVIQIGTNPDSVTAGDTVLFRQGAGLEQVVDGEKHFIMKQNDLLAVIPA